MQVGSSNTPNIQFIGSGSAKAATVGASAASEISFWDVLDVINPLQHIPIISHAYRAITGDTMSAAANIAGGTLFGGPIGGAVAAVSEAAKSIMGSEDETQTALVENSATEQNAAQQASNAYHRIRITTEDWLNPYFGQDITV